MKANRVVKLLTLVVPLVVLGLVLGSGSCLATTYYVSSSTGSDSWPGTEAQPWQTLWKASQITYQPGDQILLMRGDTWSDEGQPNKCELVLSGSADIRTEDWITLGAYGGLPRWSPRPHITHPSKDSTPGLLDWSDVITWAQEHPGTGFDQYLDRTYIRIAIRIDGNGWKIRDIEISEAEMGIANHLTASVGLWIENIYMHDMKGLAWPKHPNYPNELFGCSPHVFGAMHLGALNATIRDCTIDKNYTSIGDPVFLGGDGIYGSFFNTVFDNLYINKAYGGGMASVSGRDIVVKNSTILHGEWGEDEYGNFKGAWYGPCSFDIAYSTNFTIANSEVAFVVSGPNTADEEAVSINGENVNIKVQDCFLHDCNSKAVVFHYGIGIPKNRLVALDRNVTYRNGMAPYYPQPTVSLAGDCLPFPPEYYEGESDITWTDNRVYKEPGQYLHAYCDNLPEHSYNDFDYFEANTPYLWSNRNNQVFTAYDNYVPPPPATSKTNIALLSYPGFAIAVSSNSADTWYLIDSDFTTHWSPDPSDTAPWIALGWDATKQIDMVRLFDRRDLYNCTRAGVLAFSDGSWINVTGGILDNGAMREVVFDAAKNVTYANFNLNMDRKEGTPGISEIQVYLGSGPTPPPTPPSGDGSCSFDRDPRAPTGPLTGYFDAINWSYADWEVKKVGPNRFAYLNFPPIVFPGPPTYYYPAQFGQRAITLPPGKTLHSIKVNAPTGAVVCISQQGVGYLQITDGNGTWKNYTTGWTAATADALGILVCTSGVTNDENGIMDAGFDDITYGN